VVFPSSDIAGAANTSARVIAGTPDFEQPRAKSPGKPESFLHCQPNHLRMSGVNMFRMHGLSIDCEYDRVLKLRAEGPLSHVCKPFIRRMNDRLSKEKPARVDHEQVIASTWLPPIPGEVFKRLIRAEVGIALGKYVPETVSFEITRKCGCDCEHCAMSDGEYELTLDEIKNTIDQALDMGTFVITFTEGDPLLHSDLFELIEYIDCDRAIINIFTPGLEMTPAIASRLKECGLHNLLISIYSTDPSKHDAVRRVDGAFESAIHAIGCGLSAGLLVTMSTHVSHDRMHELPGLYDLACDLGVHEFSVWESMDGSLTDDDRSQILEMYHSINRSPGGPRMFANTYFEGEMLGCLAGQRWLHICVDGSIRPCPYLPQTAGNVRDTSLVDIWKSIRDDKRFSGKKNWCIAQNPAYTGRADE
jgi:MoaA/NifB/PqqE/SkfB family radical SAM enzyme